MYPHYQRAGAGKEAGMIGRKFFRNKEMVSVGDEIIDPESLWELTDMDTRLRLVDDDAFITVSYEENKENFKSEANGTIH